MDRAQDEDKTMTGTGATSSRCPDLTQIPYSLLATLAQRFEEGERKHGRDNWRKGVMRSPEALNDSPPVLNPYQRYALERLNHIIRHCYALAAQLQRRPFACDVEDSPAGNIGAIAWGAAFLAEACPPMLGESNDD